MKKGFTLIELLAVLVILSIIALIAVPIVQNMIHDSRKNATLRSAEFYIDAVDQAISIRQTDIKFDLENGTYIVNQNGNLCINDACSETLLVDVENTKPTSGSVDIEDNRVVSISNLYFPKYKYNISTVNGVLVASKNLNTRTYKLGDVAYFDVERGVACTENEYKISLGTYEITNSKDNTKETVTDYGNSKSGYNGIDNKDANQNSCLKFYVISNTNNKVTLILDHNTTASSSWNNERTNASGPLSALSILKSDTKNWKGVLTPTNYTYERKANDCHTEVGTSYKKQDCDAINYSIDYTGYNARLITAEEIAKIANINGTIGQTLELSIDSSNISTSEKKKKIGFLFDRLYYLKESANSTLVLNRSINDSSTEYGYWTATASSWLYYSDELSANALAVKFGGTIDSENVMLNYEEGIRPVIEMSIYKLK